MNDDIWYLGLQALQWLSSLYPSLVQHEHAQSWRMGRTRCCGCSVYGRVWIGTGW
jgi:hypothetical protein